MTAHLQALIDSTRRRIWLKRIISVGLLYCAAVLTAVLIFTAVSPVEIWLGFVAAATCLAIIGFFSRRDFSFRRPDSAAACAALDAVAPSKDRGLAFSELAHASKGDSRRDLVARQLEASWHSVTPSNAVSLRPSNSEMRLGVYLLVGCVVLILLRSDHRPTFNERQVALLDTVLQQEALPEAVRDEIEAARETLADEELGSEEVAAALANAQAAVDEALQSLSQAGTDSSTLLEEESPLAGEPTPTPDPSLPVTPTPTPTSQSSHPSENQSSSSSSSSGGEGQEKGSPQGQGEKEGEKKEGAADQGGKSGQSKEEKSEEGEQGGAQGAGQEGQGQGEGSQPSEGAAGGAGGEKGDQGKEQGQEGSEGSGQSGDNPQGSQQSTGSSGSQEQRALESAAQALSQMAEEQQQQAQGEKGASQSEGSQGEQQPGAGPSGEQGKPQEQGGKQPSPSDSQHNASSGESEEKNSASGGSGSESQSEKSDAPSDSKESGASKGSETVSSPGEQEEGPEGGGLQGPKGFEERAIPVGGEQYDTRFTGPQAQRALNPKEAAARTDLAEVELARPEADADAAQRIPPEYRDLLGERSR